MSSAAEVRQVAIGYRIKALRLKRKMRQIDLAEKAGMSWRHLIRMERGEGGAPKQETLDRIAAALDVGRSELTGDDEDDEESDPVADLMAAVQRLVRAEIKAART